MYTPGCKRGINRGSEGYISRYWQSSGPNQFKCGSKDRNTEYTTADHARHFWPADEAKVNWIYCNEL